MTNLLAQAIDCDDPDRAAKMIQDAFGIENDDVVKYCFPTEWPAYRERRARYMGEWLKPKRVTWPRDRNPPLPAAVVRREPDPKLDRQCFIVRDHNGQALAYVYFRGGAGTALGGAPPHPRRGETHCRQHRQAAGVAARIAAVKRGVTSLQPQTRCPRHVGCVPTADVSLHCGEPPLWACGLACCQEPALGRSGGWHKPYVVKHEPTS